MPKPRRIVVLSVPPIEELDLVAPVQVLSTANRLMRRDGDDESPRDLRAGAALVLNPPRGNGRSPVLPNRTREVRPYE
jgi:hypothetical protein